MDTAATDQPDFPFAPDNAAHLRWRDWKLARYPRGVEDLIVEVHDPRDLTPAEAQEIARVCRIANMAIYSSPLAGVADKTIALRLGERLGLRRVHANPLADEDGVSSLEAVPGKAARGYIPYSNRRLLWHTDGYYNAPEESIRAFILHCVRPAAEGGENALLDHEMAWLLLAESAREHIEALCAPDALTIPANTEAGAAPRPQRTGPVFSDDGGRLHMRYTARTRSIEWRADDRTRAAVQLLGRMLEEGSPYMFKVKLEAGQGLVCNNVLHNRSAYADDAAPDAGRLIYRARYSERIAAGAAAPSR